MMAVATYTKSGNKATVAAKLDKQVFGVSVKNHELLKQAYMSYLDNGRANNARTKTRGEISGGGRKPWRQKGTGNARFGSSRNPIWRGGGVVFGPRGVENYSRKLNTSAKRAAIRQALSLTASENRISVIEAFDAKDGKVKPVVALLAKLDAKGSTLLVTAKKDRLAERAARNIPNLLLVQADYLNVYDVMNADRVIISKDALELIHQRLSASAKATANKGEAK